MSDPRLDHVTWCEAEITMLEKENAELRAKLDAWEKQEPLTHVIVRTEDITIGMDGFDSVAKLKVPLFTRPKEE